MLSALFRARFLSIVLVSGLWFSLIPGVATAQLGGAASLFIVNSVDTRYGLSMIAVDLNGDGYEDIVSGSDNFSDLLPALGGGISVRFGGPCGLSPGLVFSQENFGFVTSAGDRFGESLAAGFFNSDSFVDLAIGIPGQSVSGQVNAGAVLIVYGEEGGLDVNNTDVFSQANLAGAVEAGDAFGSSLAVADFDANGIDDLAVAVVREAVGSDQDAGAVNVIYGQAGGLSSVGNLILHQGVGGVSGDPQSQDFFGHSLAVGEFSGDGFPDLAVGIPGESIDSESDAGAVQVFLGSLGGLTTLSQFWHMDVPGIVGVPAEGEEFGYALAGGDFDGDSVLDLAIGAPGHAALAISEAGAFHVIYGAAGSGLGVTGNQRFFSSVLGTSANFDRFGEVLAAGDFDLDGRDDLAAAGPLDNQGDVVNSGGVVALYGTSSGLGLAGSRIFNAELAGGVLQVGEEMGFALATGAFRHPQGGDGLVIGAPGRVGWAGAVNAGAIYVAFSEFPFLEGFESGNFCAWSSVSP